MIGPSFRPKPELPYFTVPEMLQFKRQKENGEITFFRMGACVKCGKEQPKNKKFCSKDCYNKVHAKAAAFALERIMEDDDE